MIPLLLAVALLHQDPDPVRDLEKELDRILAACAGFEEKFTPGAAGECIRQAHVMAGVAERAGDAKALAAVEALAVERISKAISALESRSSDLRRMQNQLEKGKKRAAAMEEPRRATTLRYALDRALQVVSNLSAESTELMNLGLEYAKAGALEEAEDALMEAESKLPLLRASTWEATAEAPRLAPLILARVRAAQGRIKEGADDLRRGIERYPEWLERDLSFKEALHAKPEDGVKLVKSLEARGDDPDALLLLGHEKYFSEERAKSKDVFERVLRKRPEDKTAKKFLEKF